jgi:hypothetical protein
VASLVVIRRRRRLTDRVLGDRILGGFAGLHALLGRALGDGALVIDVWDAPSGEFRQVAGPATSASRPGRELVAYDGEQALARMSTTSPAIGDGQTADAAVRFCARRCESTAARGAGRAARELEAARTRLSMPRSGRARTARDLQRPFCRRCRWPPKRWRLHRDLRSEEVGGFLPSRSMSCRRSGDVQHPSTARHRSCSAAANSQATVGHHAQCRAGWLVGDRRRGWRSGCRSGLVLCLLRSTG